MLRSHVEGPLKFTAALLPKVRDCILMIGSDVVSIPHPGLVVYSASKAALVSAALTLAEAVAQPRVLVVHPDRAGTGMNEFQGRDPAEVARVIADAVDRRGRTAVRFGNTGMKESTKGCLDRADRPTRPPDGT